VDETLLLAGCYTLYVGSAPLVQYQTQQQTEISATDTNE